MKFKTIANFQQLYILRTEVYETLKKATKLASSCWVTSGSLLCTHSVILSRSCRQYRILLFVMILFFFDSYFSSVQLLSMTVETALVEYLPPQMEGLIGSHNPSLYNGWLLPAWCFRG